MVAVAACPSCQARLKIANPDVPGGKLIRCPKCRNTFRHGPGKVSKAGIEAHPSLKALHIHCATCHARLTVKVPVGNLQKKKFKCPKCQAVNSLTPKAAPAVNAAAISKAPKQEGKKAAVLDVPQPASDTRELLEDSEPTPVPAKMRPVPAKKSRPAEPVHDEFLDEPADQPAPLDEPPPLDELVPTDESAPTDEPSPLDEFPPADEPPPLDELARTDDEPADEAPSDDAPVDDEPMPPSEAPDMTDEPEAPEQHRPVTPARLPARPRKYSDDDDDDDESPGVRRWLVVTLVILVLAGGGYWFFFTGGSDDGPFPVSGVITLDGAPYAGATVAFNATDKKGRPASGVADADGKFRLTTSQEGDGAMRGKYKVTVSFKKQEEKLDVKKMAAGVKNVSKEPHPARYNSIQSTPFEVEVPTSSPVELKLVKDTGLKK